MFAESWWQSCTEQIRCVRNSQFRLVDDVSVTPALYPAGPWSDCHNIMDVSHLLPAPLGSSQYQYLIIQSDSEVPGKRIKSKTLKYANPSARRVLLLKTRISTFLIKSPDIKSVDSKPLIVIRSHTILFICIEIILCYFSIKTVSWI